MMGSVHAVWVFGAIALVSMAMAYVFRSETMRSSLAYVAIGATTAAMAFTFHAVAFAKVDVEPEIPGELVQELLLRDCALCPQMARIPGGTLRYERDDGSAETHRIWPGFLIAEKPVSRRTYAVFVSETGRAYINRAPSAGLDTPERCVSRQDAEAYAQWLIGKSSQPYEIPSDVQWRYALKISKAQDGLKMSHGMPELVGDCDGACSGSTASTGLPFRVMRRLSLALD